MSPHVPMKAKEWFTVAELAELKLPGLATTRRGVQMVADREGWATYKDVTGAACSRPRKARGGGTEYHLSLLPEAARAKLSTARPASVDKADRESALLRYERLRQSLKDEALRRLTIIQRVETLQRDGLTKTKAIDYAAEEIIREARVQGVKASISPRTIHAWFELVRGVQAHDRVAYLAPAHGGRTTVAEIPTEAWERYKTEFLCNERTSYAQCYRLVKDLAPSKEWILPCPKTFERRIVAEIPASLIIRRRQGVEMARHTYPHADRARPDYPMQVVNLDGHTWDFEVIWEDGSRGRPTTVAIQDIASGMFLAARHAPTLSHHAVRLALGDTLRDYGLPDALLMDNGSENQHRFIAGGIPRLRKRVVEGEPWGILKILGIKAIFAQPYWGQAKPIERMFRDFAHDMAKHPAFEGAYTGHNVLNKPENYRTKAVPIAVFRRVFAEWVAGYQRRQGRRGVGMNGRSALQVFQEGINARPPKRLTEDQLSLCMLTSLPRPMHRVTGEVSIMDHRYWSPELGDLPRRPVVLRFDPDDLSKTVRVYDRRGNFLCMAERTEEGDFESMEKAARIAKLKRDYLRQQAKADAKLTIYDRADNAAALEALNRRAEALPTPDTNVVSPAFKVSRRASQAAAAINFEEQQDRAIAQFRSRP